MRAIITSSSFLVVIAICVLIHCSIISTNMRDNEVANGLDKAADYAMDVMSDVYSDTSYNASNSTQYVTALMQTFCGAVNEKIGTDGEITVQVVEASVDTGRFDIIITEDYTYPYRARKGRCSCEKALAFTA